LSQEGSYKLKLRPVRCAK